MIGGQNGDLLSVALLVVIRLVRAACGKKQGTNSGLRRWSKKGRNKMQSLPPELELPEGDRFTLPTVSAVRELIPSGGQLPAHMVLMMICGKELWVPLDKEIARQMANILAPFRE
jgi:hypothetical protein